MKKNLIEQVLKTVRNYGMLKPGDSVLLAVSGGPDSVFMMYAFARLARKLKLKKVAVCNLDHCLRGEESEEDSEFVRLEAGRLGMECYCKKVDIASVKDRKMSTEEAAREVRYRFFAEAAAKSGANILATGHTIDDQAETVLMRLIKGSSLKGLVGIAPVRALGEGLKVVRPLFELEKPDILCWLDSSGIRYRIDSSNLEDMYFRNVVRREIIPYLEKHNPRLKRALVSLAEHLREDFEFIKEEKSRVAGKITSGAGTQVCLKDIVVQPAAIRKEIMRDCLESAGGEVKKLNFRHWKEVDALLRSKVKGRSVDLPGAIRVTRTQDRIIFKKSDVA